MKKTLSVVLIICVLLVSTVHAIEMPIGLEKHVEIKLEENERLMAEVFSADVVASVESLDRNATELEFDYTCDSEGVAEAELTFAYDGATHSVAMNGFVEEVATDKYVGDVGVFFGEFIHNHATIPVCLNVTYCDPDSLITFSIGAVSPENDPIFVVYGDFTDAISAVNQQYAETQSTLFGLASEKESRDVNGERALQADNSIYYQGSDYITMNGYELGAVALYHANENEQGENASVYGRIVSNCDNAIDYLVERQSVTSSLIYDIYPIRATLELSSENRYFGSTGYHDPDDGATTVGITLPFYGGPIVGVQVISVSYTTNSTNVTTSRLSGAPKDTTVTWELYKSGGFSDIDGSLDDLDDDANSAGLVTQTQYQYEGNISTGARVTIDMEASGSLVYEYQYVTTSGMLPFTLITTTGVATGEIVVIGD